MSTPYSPKLLDTCWECGGVFPLCRDAVSVFYISSRLGIILSSVVLLVTSYVMIDFFVQWHVNFPRLFKVILYKYKYINKFVVQYQVAIYFSSLGRGFWHSCQIVYRNQWQIRGQKAPSFGWATFRWASCNIDTFVPYV